MQIAIVFAQSLVSEKEQQLVQAVSELPFVTRTTLFAASESRTLLERLQQLRATVERKVARATLAVRELPDLAAGNMEWGILNQLHSGLAARADFAECVINLSGNVLLGAAGAPGVPVALGAIVELWHDGARSSSLGVLQAPGAPAREIVVTVARSGNDKRYVVERSVLTRTPETPAGDRENAAGRSIALIVRALRQMHGASADWPGELCTIVGTEHSVDGQPAAKMATGGFVGDGFEGVDPTAVQDCGQDELEDAGKPGNAKQARPQNAKRPEQQEAKRPGPQKAKQPQEAKWPQPENAKRPEARNTEQPDTGGEPSAHKATALPTKTAQLRPWAEADPDASTLNGAASALLATARTISDAVVRRVTRPIIRRDAWEILYRTDTAQFVSQSGNLSPNGFRHYRSDYEQFVADPIAFQHNGIDALFYEEFSHHTRRGRIACAVLDGNDTLGTPRCVLERPYHLSYPFVFEYDSNVFMIPESSANATVDLYKCTDFPYEWQFEQTLITGMRITDATLHHDGERWWMFATVGEAGSYAWDELHLFTASAPAGVWTAHLNNPVKCDSRTARPAGPLYWHDGRLIRPTQDCSTTYGGAINLCEITMLTMTGFAEVEVGRLSPSTFRATDGLHTISATRRLEVIDVRPRRRWRWEK